MLSVSCFGRARPGRDLDGLPRANVFLSQFRRKGFHRLVQSGAPAEREVVQALAKPLECIRMKHLYRQPCRVAVFAAPPPHQPEPLHPDLGRSEPRVVLAHPDGEARLVASRAYHGRNNGGGPWMGTHRHEDTDWESGETPINARLNLHPALAPVNTATSRSCRGRLGWPARRPAPSSSEGNPPDRTG